MKSYSSNNSMTKANNNTASSQAAGATGTNISKLLLLFALVTFGVMLVLSVFVLAPRVEDTLTQQKIAATETTIRLHAENIRQYFADRAILMRDLTRFPAIITSTMTLDSNNVALKELLSNASILGQHLPMALLDIDGEIIYSTDEKQFANHDSHLWAKALVSGESEFYLELLRDDTGDHFEIAVPVIFRGAAEGILVAIIPSQASNILTGRLDDTSFYVELQQGNTIFSSQRDIPLSSILTRQIRLKKLNLDLTYIIDKSPLLQEASTIRNQLLWMLSLAILLAFAIFLVFGYRTLVLPYKALSEVSTKLRDAGKELQLIFDNVPARIWYKDGRNRILRLNSQAAESMGMSVADAVGQNTYELFPEMAKQYHDDDLAVINSGKPRLGIVEEYTPLDGERGWVSTDKVPYTDPETGQSSVLVVSKDITELKAVQSALAESEERYEVAVKGSSVGLWDWNVVTDELYWSPRFMEILGLDEADFIPELSSFSDRLHPDDLERVMNALTQHIENGTEYNVEYRLKHEQGHYVWIHARGQALWNDDGEAIRCAGSIADISSRKHDEQALIESEERFRIAITGSSVGVWDYDLVNDKLFWSPLHKEMFGIADEDFVPHGSEFFDRIHPNDTAFVNEAFNKHLQYQDEYNLEFRLQHNDGHYIWIHVRGQALWNEDGKAIRIAGSTADISIRKMHEEALIEAKRALSNTVDQLTQSNDELARFAYVASHDLQEPIRMIGNFTQLLKRNYHDQLDKDGQQYLEICNESATRMQTLISDLLSYARTDSEADTYSEVDMSTALRHTLDHLTEAIKESNATIDSGPLPTVHFNPPRLTRLLQNLIGNSIKYRQNDIPPAIKISHENRDDCWQISVQDNGIGMKQEYLHKIFEPFKRLHHKDQYGGTGIGLAICEKIVEQRGGKIWVESKPEHGTTFYFTIPK